jgi:hypothetical protein
MGIQAVIRVELDVDRFDAIIACGCLARLGSTRITRVRTKPGTKYWDTLERLPRFTG